MRAPVLASGQGFSGFAVREENVGRGCRAVVQWIQKSSSLSMMVLRLVRERAVRDGGSRVVVLWGDMVCRRDLEVDRGGGVVVVRYW